VASQQLKRLRNRRNITVREVEQASRRIADVKGDKRFQISNGWLAQLENGVSEPSIRKLFSLSVIYHVKMSELLRLYNVDVENQEKYESVANPHLTQLLSNGSATGVWPEPAVSSPATGLVPGASPQFRSPAISDQGHGNGSANGGSGKSKLIYGYVGSSDLTMYPLIRPGSLLQIDTSQNKLQTAAWHNEFERPIYFVELRDAYACGWCELQRDQLLIIPHHSSPASVRRFTYLREAEIVGRVVGYYTSSVDLQCETLMRS
jgi:transcriptional regulator with XRE-family HTH domain